MTAVTCRHCKRFVIRLAGERRRVHPECAAAAKHEYDALPRRRRKAARRQRTVSREAHRRACAKYRQRVGLQGTCACGARMDRKAARCLACWRAMRRKT